jgi:hypothetical protein
LLQCSEDALYKQIKKGKLLAFRIGTCIRLCPRTTADWLRSRSTNERAI